MDGATRESVLAEDCDFPYLFPPAFGQQTPDSAFMLMPGLTSRYFSE